MDHYLDDARRKHEQAGPAAGPLEQLRESLRHARQHASPTPKIWVRPRPLKQTQIAFPLPNE